MKHETFCQSCGMPMDGSELWGTEANGEKNASYCKYCYRNGFFVQPEITLEQMRERAVKKMEDHKIPADIIESLVQRLPLMARWRKKV